MDFFEPPEEGRVPASWLGLLGKVFSFVLFLYWLKAYLLPDPAQPTPWVFLDYANLVFHEAGHVLFMFFGQFFHILGGSLTQLLVPGIVLLAFLKKRDYFAACWGLFWLGESTLNLSIYISDARWMYLDLLGDASIHDWNWLLGRLGILDWGDGLGKGVFWLGILLIIISLGGIIWNISRDWQELHS